MTDAELDGAGYKAASAKLAALPAAEDGAWQHDEAEAGDARSDLVTAAAVAGLTFE